MKMPGLNLASKRSMVVPIPRGPDTVEFHLTYVNDYSEFEALVPYPQMQEFIGKNGRERKETPDFKKELDEYSLKKGYWIIYQTLKETPGLEWDTVKENDPDSWVKINDELKAAQFSDKEIAHLYEQVWSVNGMNQKLLDDALKLFFWQRDRSPRETNAYS